MKCKRCHSHAINHHCHGRDGSGEDLCDVCYWRNIAEKHDNSFQGQLLESRKRIIELENELNATQKRIKQLEDRIHRASMAFFRDGSDGQVASGMLAILEEERRKQ